MWACPKDACVIDQIFTTTCDWKISMLGWTFTLFFLFLGFAAAIWGGWVERVGPRKAGVVATLCWWWARWSPPWVSWFTSFG